MKIVTEGVYTIDGKTYERALVSCGKPSCHCMRTGTLHGPYWYRRIQKCGRTIRRYLGRELLIEGKRKTRELATECKPEANEQPENNTKTIIEQETRDMFTGEQPGDPYYGHGGEKS